MKISTSIYTLVLFAVSCMPALAAIPVTRVPEPGALPLLAIGAAAAALVWFRGRDKK